MGKKPLSAQSQPVNENAAPQTQPSASPAPQETAGFSDDLGASVAGSMASMPPPNEEAIAAHATREAVREAREAGEQAAKKPRGRQPGTKYPRKTKAGSSIVLPGNSPEAHEARYRLAGEAAADGLIMLGMTFGGADWEPKPAMKDKEGNVVYDERQTLRKGWGDMFVAYEWENVPAWAACAICTGMYIVPRLNAPSTISRLDKVKLWFAERKLSKDAKKRAAAERAEKEKREREARA